MWLNLKQQISNFPRDDSAHTCCLSGKHHFKVLWTIWMFLLISFFGFFGSMRGNLAETVTLLFAIRFCLHRQKFNILQCVLPRALEETLMRIFYVREHFRSQSQFPNFNIPFIKSKCIAELWSCNSSLFLKLNNNTGMTQRQGHN